MGLIKHVSTKGMTALLMEKMTLTAFMGSLALTLFIIWLVQGITGQWSNIVLGEGISVLIMLTIPIIAMALIVEYSKANFGNKQIPYAGLGLIIMMMGLMYFMRWQAPYLFTFFDGQLTNSALSMFSLI